MATVPCESANGINWDKPMSDKELKRLMKIVLTVLRHTVVAQDGAPPLCMDELAEHIMSSQIDNASRQLEMSSLRIDAKMLAAQQLPGLHRLCEVNTISNKSELMWTLRAFAGLTNNLTSESNSYMTPFAKLPSQLLQVARAREFVVAGVGVPAFLHMKLPGKDNRVHTAVYWALLDPGTSRMRLLWNAAAVEPVPAFLELHDDRIQVYINRPVHIQQENDAKFKERLQFVSSDAMIASCTRDRCNFRDCVDAVPAIQKKCRLCANCRQVAYCSVEHQTKDWPRHKLLCKRLKAACS
jgi:hypothetical protein